MRIKGQDGFTLVELMITMVVFVLAMAAASNIFSGLLNQFKQQSRIAESNIEGISGLELMRHDLEQAGFGLPWNINGANYNEAVAGAIYDPTNANAAIAAISASDARLNEAAGNAPSAVAFANGVLMNGSDVLVIRATNIATNAASQKWEYIVNNGAFPNLLRNWGGSTAEMLDPNDHVIIVNPSAGARNQKVLVNNGGFDVQLKNPNFSFNAGGAGSPFEPPTDSYTAYVAYGVSPGALRMPFNRADFYLKRPADVPTRCEQSTGVLYKGMVNQADGMLTELPLLDCVLDMKVVFAYASVGGGPADNWLASLPAATAPLQPAQVIRDQLKEIRVYLIVQEGQMDTSYKYVNPDPSAPASDRNMVYVKDPNCGNVYGTDCGGPGTQNGYTVPNLNYRWKLHTIVVTPYNLK